MLRRFFFVVLALITLAMLPPSFPNAAAHALSLALVAAELVLVGINLVLFALVHLAVFLNKVRFFLLKESDYFKRTFTCYRAVLTSSQTTVLLVIRQTPVVQPPLARESRTDDHLLLTRRG